MYTCTHVHMYTCTHVHMYRFTPTLYVGVLVTRIAHRTAPLRLRRGWASVCARLGLSTSFCRALLFLEGTKGVLRNGGRKQQLV